MLDAEVLVASLNARVVVSLNGEEIRVIDLGSLEWAREWHRMFTVILNHAITNGRRSRVQVSTDWGGQVPRRNPSTLINPRQVFDSIDWPADFLRPKQPGYLL